MTTPSREQVVQWAKEAGFVAHVENLDLFATLARADLEAKVAEQHEIITALEIGLAEQAAEIESLRKDAVPEGWALVPIEPTNKMLSTLHSAYINGDSLCLAYCAMLSASPSPDSEK